MSQFLSISTKELERIAGLAYEGKTVEVMLCSAGLTGYGAEDLISDWETVEQSTNGYVRYTELLGTGSYSSTSGSYELPQVFAEFTATTGGYNFDTVVIFFTGELYPYAIITESPNIVIADGQTQTYRIKFRTDD